MHETHGLSKHPLYARWGKIVGRCYNKNQPDYPRYGDRGIKMCEEWRNDFRSFYDWSIANGYREDLSIDRIDNNGNYEPSNCRWVDNTVQANNKRNNHLIEINGETKTLAEWCKIYNQDYFTVEARIRIQGYTPLKALTTYRKRLWKGKMMSLKAICREEGVDYKMVHQRMKVLGWDFEKAISEPKHNIKQ